MSNQTPPPVAPQYQTQPVQTVALPSLAPTVLVTIFFGLFGLIPASMGASKAQAVGQDGSRYWKAFWIVFAIEVVLIVLIWLLAVGVFFAAMATS